MLNNDYSFALKIQALHIFFCVVWNGVGLWQLLHGIQTIGPTASATAITVLIVILAFLVFSLHQDWMVAYFSASLVVFGLAVLTIFGGFTKDPGMWSTEFWRYAGIVVNFIGVLGFLLAVRVYLGRHKK